MPMVMLKGDWPGNFHRSVRDGDGRVVERLEFAPGEPVSLDHEQYAAVADDIGKSLVHVTLDPKGRPRIVEQPVEGDAAPVTAARPGEEPTPEDQDQPPEGTAETGAAAENSDATSLDQLSLETDVRKTLESAGIASAEELARRRHAEDLTEIKGIGPRSVEAVDAALAEWAESEE